MTAEAAAAEISSSTRARTRMGGHTPRESGKRDESRVLPPPVSNFRAAVMLGRAPSLPRLPELRVIRLPLTPCFPLAYFPDRRPRGPGMHWSVPHGRDDHEAWDEPSDDRNQAAQARQLEPIPR